MTITENAKAVLDEMLKNEGKDGLSFDLVGSGCQSQLMIDFIDEADCTGTVDGVLVKMNEEVKEFLADVILDERAGGLVFRVASSCGGCGGGCCGGDEEDSGCCSGGCCA